MTKYGLMRMRDVWLPRLNTKSPNSLSLYFDTANHSVLERENRTDTDSFQDHRCIVQYGPLATASTPSNGSSLLHFIVDCHNHETSSAEIIPTTASDIEMGSCLSCCCCCCGSRIDPEDPSVTAYILTTRYIRHGAGKRQKYMCPTPRAVYVRREKLYFDCCACAVGGFPLSKISSVDVVRGATILVGHRGLFLDPGVRIKGNDGTSIAFTAPNAEVDMFVLQLRSAVATARGDKR